MLVRHLTHDHLDTLGIPNIERGARCGRRQHECAPQPALIARLSGWRGRRACRGKPAAPRRRSRSRSRRRLMTPTCPANSPSRKTEPSANDRIRRDDQLVRRQLERGDRPSLTADIAHHGFDRDITTTSAGPSKVRTELRRIRMKLRR